MKVIFLDIDGVLNSTKSTHRQREELDNRKYDDIPDKVHIHWLNYIILNTGAKVVLSSSWRKYINTYLMEMLLYTQGFKGSIISRTGEFGKRAEEIRSWLSDRKRESSEIESYVILDDEFMKINNFVRCDPIEGLGEMEAQKAIEILNRKEERDGS